MSKHTKGPWIAVGRRVEHPNDRIPDICSCIPEDFGQEGRSDEEACANARLIAAAPDMLHALWVARLSVKHGGAFCEEVLDIINDAITLATGEKP